MEWWNEDPISLLFHKISENTCNIFKINSELWKLIKGLQQSEEKFTQEKLQKLSENGRAYRILTRPTPIPLSSQFHVTLKLSSLVTRVAVKISSLAVTIGG